MEVLLTTLLLANVGFTAKLLQVNGKLLERFSSLSFRVKRLEDEVFPNEPIQTNLDYVI